VLLASFSRREDRQRLPDYIAWLGARTKAKIVEHPAKIADPSDWSGIYEAALEACKREKTEDTELTFHMTPGSRQMGAVWMLLGKTVFSSAKLLESSREQGVKTVDVPFNIAAEYVDLLRKPDERLRKQSTAVAPDAAEFGDIIHRSGVMAHVIQRARKVAPRNVSVLIEGETGTGKELFAKAIHKASPRRDKPFKAVNCGAIPPTLVESVLFGYERGAFTGASKLHKGLFEEADGGTLFLDELGELPLDAQVKLLRVLQESTVSRIGATKEIKVDVRVISATNRTLIEEVRAGRFREDLFYRLAVAVLKIPPLRERAGDIGLLTDELLKKENDAATEDPGYARKDISVDARKLLLDHPWPGNVRELQLTLRRMVIWSEAKTISADEVRQSLLDVPKSQHDVLGRPLGDGFKLKDLLAEVARHYLERAMEQAGGNKTKAAMLVGLPGYQTLTNWLKKYRAEP